MLGLTAAGEVESPEVRRGAEYLIRTQQEGGFWNDEPFTAPGFPRVFYLKYHGYDKYFPLWALARFSNLQPRGAV
jgi:squalene-hopene/tetraprenyl-beta-curcumene cyclase